MKTILFIVGSALGHVGRSLTIARSLRRADSGVRIIFAHISPGHGDHMLSDEFECLGLHRRDRGERFADQVESVIKSVDPALICLDLSPVPWLYLVRFPEIPRAYITNYFLTSLHNAESFQDRHLAENSTDLNSRRVQRGWVCPRFG